MKVPSIVDYKSKNKIYFHSGGGKIWECTQDLGDYIMKSANEENSLFKSLRNKYVLDLGCGAGILGILSLKAGAFVHFSDYVN